MSGSQVFKTKYFDLPVLRRKNGEYKLQSKDVVYTCFYSDFFIEAADLWRLDAWAFIKERSDLNFLFLTKRTHRYVPFTSRQTGTQFVYDGIHFKVARKDQSKQARKANIDFHPEKPRG
jgi:hypothetical protein